MTKFSKQIIAFVLCVIVFAGCNTTTDKTEMHYEVLSAGIINDSLSNHHPGYKDDLILWKTAYEHCMNDTLFHNAIYLGLQNKIGISSICNQTAQNLNKQITVLDTSANGNIFNILSVNNSANCFSKINLNKSLQDSLYIELIRNLKKAGEYSFLSNLVDTNQIVFKIGTMTDISLRPDSLVSLLQRTKDTSLIYFRQILTAPGNGLLARVVMILGFDAQFHLNRKLSAGESGSLKNQVFFLLGDYGERGSAQVLPNQDMKVVISKNYIVFGEFYVFNQTSQN
jgi:hypothetical protein